MAWYNTPNPVQYATVAPTRLDFGDLGSKIGNAIKNYQLGNIIKNTTRNQGETDEEYKARIAKARTSVNPVVQQDTAPQVAAISNDERMSREPDNLYKPETSIDANGVYTQTQPGMFDAGQKSFESIAPQQMSTGKVGYTPEEIEAQRQQAVAEQAPQRGPEALSDYYIRLGNALSRLDPKQALQYKQEALKQRAIEDFQKKSTGMSSAERIVGVGETMLPFNSEQGTQEIVAGTNLGMAGLNNAKENLGPAAAAMRGITTDAEWTSERAKQVANNPFIAKYIPEHYSQNAWNQVMTAGGHKDLVQPEVGSFAENESIRKSADLAANSVNMMISQDPRDPRIPAARELAVKLANEYTQRMFGGVTNAPAPSPSPAPSPAPVVTPAPTTGPVVMKDKMAKGKAPAVTTVAKEPVLTVAKLPQPPKMRGTDIASKAQYDQELANYKTTKDNYDAVMTERQKARADLKTQITSGDKTNNAYKAAEAQKLALENPDDADKLINAFASSDAAIKAAGDQNLFNQLITSGKQTLLAQIGIEKGSSLTAEQKQMLLEKIKSGYQTNLATIRDNAKYYLGGTSKATWAQSYGLPPTDDNGDLVINKEVDDFMKGLAINEKKTGKEAMKLKMSSAAMPSSSSMAPIKKGARL